MRTEENFMGIRICPDCGGKVSTSRNECIHCGHVFETKVCPDCEESIDICAKECPICGHIFIQTQHSVSTNGNVNNEDPSVSIDGFEFEIIGDHAVLKKVDANKVAGNVVTPSIYKGKPVTIIGECAFLGCNNLTSVTIGNSVTAIGNNAFYDCYNLTSVTFGENSQLTTIGKRAFYYCSNLTSIVIPDSVTAIGELSFGMCSKMINVYYTGDIAGWCGISFTNSTANPMCFADRLYINGKLVEGELVIPSTITKINSYAFRNCGSLTSLVIPDSVISIGNRAFANCSSLTNIYYTGTETKWKKIAIGIGNASLTKATIKFNFIFVQTQPIVSTKSNVNNDESNIRAEEFEFEIVGDHAVLKKADANIVTGNVVIPSIYQGKPVTSIGDFAFGECSRLISIAIPDTVTTIGELAFYNCTSLTSITIPDSVTAIKCYTFYGCSRLKSVKFEYQSGWYVSTKSNAVNGINLILINASNNAKYLKSTYRGYYWYKK